MDFYTTSQCFDYVDGVLQFVYTKILYTIGDDLYQARCHRRLPTAAIAPCNMDKLELTNITKIDPGDYCPKIPADCTIVTDPHESRYYVKRPNLTYFGELLDLRHLVLVEIAACEAFKRSPHPNIARYHGCKIHDGRVTGLCFEIYKETLMARLNPGALNNEDFKSFHHNLPRKQIDRYVAGIAAGLHHLHAHGFVHNDINPNNIMFTTNDTPVIIDFDSCLKQGIQDGQVKQNSWYCGGTSGLRNDENAFEALKEWMYNGCKRSKIQALKEWFHRSLD